MCAGSARPGADYQVPGRCVLLVLQCATVAAGLYYYYKPEYLDLLADRAGCEDWVQERTLVMCSTVLQEPWITWHEGEQGWGCQVRLISCVYL